MSCAQCRGNCREINQQGCWGCGGDTPDTFCTVCAQKHRCCANCGFDGLPPSTQLELLRGAMARLDEGSTALLADNPQTRSWDAWEAAYVRHVRHHTAVRARLSSLPASLQPSWSGTALFGRLLDEHRPELDQLWEHDAEKHYRGLTLDDVIDIEDQLQCLGGITRALYRHYAVLHA